MKKVQRRRKKKKDPKPSRIADWTQGLQKKLFDGPVDIILEIRGGTLVAVYAKPPEPRIALIDWDNVLEGDDPGVISIDGPINGRECHESLLEVSDRIKGRK